MAPLLGLAAVAFVSPQNHPILVRSFDQKHDNLLKYHYIAHTSLDVIDERIAAAPKSVECYLGFLYSMEDVAVYAYITPSKVKIILALALTDAVVRDADIITIFKALHLAYYRSAANPFLRLNLAPDAAADHGALLLAGSTRWSAFRARVDDVARAAGAVALPNP